MLKLKMLLWELLRQLLRWKATEAAHEKRTHFRLYSHGMT